MPSLFFDVQEVQETKVSRVNISGYAYVGRQHSGKEITWIRLKECPKKKGSKTSTPKSTSPL